jgi:hypothetical protein
MTADIATGHHAAADIAFLAAVIAAGLAAVIAAGLAAASSIIAPPARAWHELVWAPILGWAAVALLALGLMLL